MNLWPFSKKTKTSANERFDLPPGVKLADPSDPETFSTPPEPPLQVGLPPDQAPEVARPHPNQPAEPRSGEGGWENLPISAEALLNTGMAAHSQPLQENPPIGVPTPDTSITGVDFSHALPQEPTGEQAIPTMESLFTADLKQTSTPQAASAFDSTLDSAPGLPEAAPNIPQTGSSTASTDTLHWEQSFQDPEQTQPSAFTQEQTPDPADTASSLQQLRQKLNGQDSPTTSHPAHLPIQEPNGQTNGGFSTLEQLKQQAIQESTPSWLHDPGSMETATAFSPPSESQAPSALNAPDASNTDAFTWENPIANEPAINTPMALEPSTGWALPREDATPTPSGWNIPNPAAELAPPTSAPIAFPDPLIAGLPDLPSASEPLSPPAWSDNRTANDSFWESPLAGATNELPPPSSGHTQPDSLATSCLTDAVDSSTPAAASIAHFPETDAASLPEPGTTFDIPTADTTPEAPLPTLETPTFMQTWGHPDPVPEADNMPFSLPDPLTDGLTMNASDAQPYLQAEADDTPMDFLYGESDFDESGDFDNLANLDAAFEPSEDGETGIYAFDADNDTTEKDFTRSGFSSNRSLADTNDDDGPIDEDAPSIAADFETYDMGHYDDPEDPAPAFVLDDSPDTGSQANAILTENNVYNLLDDTELAPPEPLPDNPHNVLPFPAPKARQEDPSPIPLATTAIPAPLAETHTLEAGLAACSPETSTDETEYSSIEPWPATASPTTKPLSAPLEDATTAIEETGESSSLFASPPTMDATTTDEHPTFETAVRPVEMPVPLSATVAPGQGKEPASADTPPHSTEKPQRAPLVLKPVPLERTIFQPPKKPLKPFDPNLCERPTPYTDTLAEALHDFEKQILLEDTRFLKHSINNLVEQYFSQQEPDSAW